MILLLDNFDSFSFNLVDYLRQAGAEVEVLRNDIPLAQIKNNNYTGVVLSPGPETPPKAGNLMRVLDHYIDQLPILGICLGHQALGMHFGSQLIKAEKPMHGKISSINCEPHYIFEGLEKKIDVVRYNSLILDKIHLPLKVIATSKRGEIMAVGHSQLPLVGLQFHPEAALTNGGRQMIKNWVKFNDLQTK